MKKLIILLTGILLGVIVCDHIYNSNNKDEDLDDLFVDDDDFFDETLL